MNWIIFVIKILCIFSINAFKHPNVGQGFMDIVTIRGYPAEEHTVTTEDGFILTIHRIPHGKNTTATNKHPVMFVGGTSATSECFVILEEDEALGFVLANNGYDVWFMNYRGSTYGMKHKYLNGDRDKEFWNYSLHEYGYYDVTASLDYILNVTKKEKVTVIGHSQGSTTLLISLSTRLENNKKVNLNVNLAPSAFIGKPTMAALQLFAKHEQFLEHLVRDVLNIYYLPTAKGLLKGLDEICASSKTFQEMCFHVVTDIDFGADQEKMFNISLIPAVLSHMPGGVSTKAIFHYIQLIRSDKFQNYDYGPEGNRKIYNSFSPPTYDVSKITVPVALFFSPYDAILPVRGIKILNETLPDSNTYEIKDPNFRHLTYIFSKYVKVIYPTLLPVLAKYNN